MTKTDLIDVSSSPEASVTRDALPLSSKIAAFQLKEDTPDRPNDQGSTLEKATVAARKERQAKEEEEEEKDVDAAYDDDAPIENALGGIKRFQYSELAMGVWHTPTTFLRYSRWIDEETDERTSTSLPIGRLVIRPRFIDVHVNAPSDPANANETPAAYKLEITSAEDIQQVRLFAAAGDGAGNADDDNGDFSQRSFGGGRDYGACHLILTLARPPKIFLFSRERWRRTNQLGYLHREQQRRMEPGRWLVYHFIVRASLHELQNQLVWHPGVEVLLHEKVPEISRSFSADVAETQQKSMHLPWSVQYLLLCAKSHNLLLEANMAEDGFLTALAETQQTHSARAAEHFLESIMVHRQRIYKPAEALQHYLRSTKYLLLKAKIIPNDEAHCVRVGKVIITPTKTYFLPPLPELTNRVLTHFSAHQDRFLRLSFTDENMMKIMPTKSDRNDRLYERCESIMRNGLYIDELHHFQLLAWSSSQLREHSCWLFAPTATLTMSDVTTFMGRFYTIQDVAKFGARMGQCFTAGRPLRTNVDQYLRIPDITIQTEVRSDRSGRIVEKEYTFSDGIGKISPDLAESIAKELDMSPTPSAFQIRAKGLKGMVAVDPTLPKGQKSILFRPSMEKFKVSRDQKLYIVRPSSWSPAFLNKQLITILDALRVPLEPFMALQEKMLADLGRMLDDAPLAIDLLCSYYAPADTNVNIVLSMLQCGLHERKDPFLMGLLHLIRQERLIALRAKSQIHVKESANLLGVLDETATLREGQCFAQITDPTHPTQRHVITGRVLVANFPVLHPGDVRILEAVDCPALHHMCDVVVFPQVGRRPATDECSGGDLDGDVYMICWHQAILPARATQPAQYGVLAKMPTPEEKAEKARQTASAAQSESSPVTRRLLREFFLEFMKNDNLGTICNLHLAMADFSEKKAFDPQCLELWALACQAVDYPKSGQPALLDGSIAMLGAYPDFMGKEDRRMYKSQRILGRLYRKVPARVAFARPQTSADAYQRMLDQPPLALKPGHEAFLGLMQLIKDDYDERIMAVMIQYNIETEIEVVSGFILMEGTGTGPMGPKHIGSVTQRRKYVEVKEKCAQAFRSIVHRSREQLVWALWLHHAASSPPESSSSSPSHQHPKDAKEQQQQQSRAEEDDGISEDEVQRAVIVHDLREQFRAMNETKRASDVSDLFAPPDAATTLSPAASAAAAERQGRQRYALDHHIYELAMIAAFIVTYRASTPPAPTTSSTIPKAKVETASPKEAPAPALPEGMNTPFRSFCWAIGGRLLCKLIEEGARGMKMI